MKKTALLKASALFLALTLAFVAVAVPGSALATVSSVSISISSGTLSIPVGGSVGLTGVANQVAPVTPITYQWTRGDANVCFSAVGQDATASTSVASAYGLVPSGTTKTRVTLSAYDTGTSSPYPSNYVDVEVLAMTISQVSLELAGGATKQLSVGNVATASTTIWSSDNPLIADVDANGVVSAIGAGTTTIRATNDPDVEGAITQEKTCSVTVTPVITLTPASANITTASTPAAFTLTVQYGGSQITTASTVSWINGNTSIGSLSGDTTFTDTGTSLVAIGTFTSAATLTSGSSTITAAIYNGTSLVTSRTATAYVRTERYLTIEGPSTLTSTSRTGTYTVTLHEANGMVVPDNTSTVHWDWTPSYLTITTSTINDTRSEMQNGQAQIQLYGRYNTPTAGTKLYAWINSDTDGKESYTIYISGLTTLPQTGQDLTLVYVFGGLGAAMLLAAGIWYGIRKARSAA